MIKGKAGGHKENTNYYMVSLTPKLSKQDVGIFLIKESLIFLASLICDILIHKNYLSQLSYLWVKSESSYCLFNSFEG